MTYVGIDPGKNTGVAVIDDGKILHMETIDFVKAYRFIEDMVVDNELSILVFIEVPRTKAFFGKIDIASADLGKGLQYVLGKVRKAQTCSHNVGRVCREAELLADMIESLGVEVTRVPPKGGLKAQEFNRLTGYTGRSNQHTRDAAMAVLRSKAV